MDKPKYGFPTSILFTGTGDEEPIDIMRQMFKIPAFKPSGLKPIKGAGGFTPPGPGPIPGMSQKSQSQKSHLPVTPVTVEPSSVTVTKKRDKRRSVTTVTSKAPERKCSECDNMVSGRAVTCSVACRKRRQRRLDAEDAS